MMCSLKDPWLSGKSAQLVNSTVSLLEMVRREPRLSKKRRRDYEAPLEVVLRLGLKILSQARDIHGDPLKYADQIMKDGFAGRDAVMRQIYPEDHRG